MIASEPDGAEKAFDKNKLTYYFSKKPFSWIGIEFTKPLLIDSIYYLPRNDNNGIDIGDTYELFFWDRGWRSLGRQVAEKEYLVYENVPNGALFWLRNLTKGKEERIFTYENGGQVWW